MSALLRLLAGVTASLIALVAMLKGSGNRPVKDPDRGSCYGREPGSCRYLQAAATTRAGFLPVQHFFLLRTKLSRKDSMALSEIRTKIVGGRGVSVRHGFVERRHAEVRKETKPRRTCCRVRVKPFL